MKKRTTNTDPDSFDNGLDNCIKNIFKILEDGIDVLSPGLIMRTESSDNRNEVFVYFFPDFVPNLRRRMGKDPIDNTPGLENVFVYFRQQLKEKDIRVNQAWFVQETTSLIDNSLRYTQHLWPPDRHSGSPRRIVQIDGRDLDGHSNQAVIFLDSDGPGGELSISRIKRHYVEDPLIEQDKTHVLDILFDRV